MNTKSYYHQMEYYSRIMRESAMDLGYVIISSTQIEQSLENKSDMNHTLLLL